LWIGLRFRKKFIVAKYNKYFLLIILNNLNLE